MNVWNLHENENEIKLSQNGTHEIEKVQLNQMKSIDLTGNHRLNLLGYLTFADFSL